MNSKGTTLVEVMITVMIISIVTSISVLRVNFNTNKLSDFGEGLVADYNLYRSLTSESLGSYCIDFNQEGYSVLKGRYGGQSQLLESKRLPDGIEWTNRPNGIVFENSNRVYLLGKNPSMTIELLDKRENVKMQITIVPVSNRISIARYLEL